MDVRAAIAELTERRHAEAEQGLCELAGITFNATTADLASGILDVATAVLADETTARGLRQDGGWAGAVRMLEEGWPFFDPEPDDPPGTLALLPLLARTSHPELAELGRRSAPERLLAMAAEAEREFGPGEGTRILAQAEQEDAAAGEALVVGLLDWALAVVTRPEGTWLDWRPTGAQRRDAVIELPAAATDLWARAEVDAKSGRYQVGPGPRDVQRHVREHPLRFGRTASLAGAVLLAEHAAAECVAGLVLRSSMWV